MGLFEQRDGLWYRPGHHLPELSFPDVLRIEGIPLARAILPARVALGASVRASPRPARLRLVRDPIARPACALRCTLEALTNWSDSVPSSRLSSILGATDGAHALMMGARLPEVAEAERYWGDDVLTPLGFRTDPELPESALKRALGIGLSEVLLLGHAGYESIPKDVFRPLQRSGLRLALGARRT